MALDDAVEDTFKKMAEENPDVNSEFIDVEEKPGEEHDLVGNANDVELPFAKDLVAERSEDKSADDKLSEDDKEGEKEVDSDLIEFAVDKYGLDPRYASSLEAAGLLAQTLQNTKAKSVEEEEIPEVKPFEHGLKADDYDPELIGAMDQMQDLINDQNKTAVEQRKELQELRSGAEKKSQGEDEARFDVMMEEFPEFEVLLGKGRSIDLPQNSKEFKNRQDVWNEINLANEVLVMRGHPVLPDKPAMKRALAIVFSDHYQELARQEIGGKLKERATNFTQRPQGVTNNPVNGDEEAFEAVRTFMGDLR